MIWEREAKEVMRRYPTEVKGKIISPIRQEYKLFATVPSSITSIVERVRMGIDLKKYTEIKDQVDSAQRRLDKQIGALEQQKAQLKKEFDCTPEQAEILLENIKLELEKEEEEYQDMLDEFDRKWKGKLQ